MRKSIAFTMMALMTASSVSAAEPDQAKPEKPKLVCKTDKLTGSLTRRIRVCKTAEQWDAESSSTREDVSKYVSDTLTQGNMPNNPATAR